VAFEDFEEKTNKTACTGFHKPPTQARRQSGAPINKRALTYTLILLAQRRYLFGIFEKGSTALIFVKLCIKTKFIGPPPMR
jgi:hypothetical protein